MRAEQLQKQVSTCDARLEQNRAARTAIDTRRQQHAAVRARWQWVHALAATANGAVPGKEKIMLETYIQTAYFDRILGRANTRLLIMSGGQYELRRCARAGDNRSQTGLELEVIEGNQRAIGLYHKMGFVCTGEKPNAIRLEDGSSLKELMMVKVL